MAITRLSFVSILCLASIVDHISALQNLDEEGGSSCILDQLGQTDVTLTQQYQQLETSVDDLSDENKQLYTTIRLLATEGAHLQFQAEEIEYDHDQLNEKISSLEENNQQSVKSAFSAYMTIGYFQPSNTTQIVVPMNGVNFNLNDDYNADTSTYTCPVDGVYYFSYAVYSSDIKAGTDDRVFAFLSVDGRYENDAYCKTDTTEKIYCQAALTATVHCNQGDAVQVKTSSNHGYVQIYGSSKYKRTNFSGHLLYVD